MILLKHEVGIAGGQEESNQGAKGFRVDEELVQGEA